jgi:GntR family transcriptional repressor for pyruvate dehydrogenase complex
MATPMFQPAKPRRAYDEILAQIRERVSRGELVPGDRLPAERALAEQFAVSRNTVREALRMLEISGLIQLRRGAAGGAFIAQADSSKVASSMSDMLELSQFSLSDLTEARGWLEALIVRVACQRADAEALDALDANVEEVARLSEAGDWERKALVNVEFHNLLAEATGNPVMVAMMQGLMDVMTKIVLRLGPTEGDVVLQSRRRLMKHLRDRDVDAAVDEMHNHLQRMHKIWIDGYYKGSRSPRA